MFDLGSLVASVEVNTKPLRKGLNKANKRLSSFSKGMGSKLKGGAVRGGRAMKGLAGTVGGTALKLTAATTAATGLAGVIGNSLVSRAEDLNQAQKATNIILGESADKLLNYSDTISKTAGVSEKEFLSMTNQMVAVLQNLGLTQEESADRTLVVTERVKDLSTVHNTEMAPAMEAYQALLRGETDQLEQYGIVINAAKVKNKAYAEGIAEKGTELTEAQKQEARHALFMEQSSNIAGAYSENVDDLAAKQKVFSARVSDLTDKMGIGLIPMKKKVVGWGLKFLDMIEDNEKEIKKFGSRVWDTTKQIGDFAKAFAKEAIPKLKEFHKNHVKPFIKTIKNDFIPKIKKDIIPMIKDWADTLVTVGGKVKDFLQPAIDRLVNSVRDNFMPIMKGVIPLMKIFAVLMGGFLAVALRAVIEILSALINTIGWVVKKARELIDAVGWSINRLKELVDFVGWFVGVIVDFFKWLFRVLVGNSIIPDMLDAIKRVFTDVLNKVYNFVKSIFTKVKNVISSILNSVWEFVKNTFIGMKNTVLNAVKTIYRAARDWFTKVYQTISGWVRRAWSVVNDVFRFIVVRLAKHVGDAYRTARDWFRKVFDAIRFWIKKARIKVNQVFRKIVLRVAKHVGDAYRTARDWFKKVYQTISGWINKAWDTVNRIFREIQGTINHWIQSAWDTVESTFHDVWSTINHWVNKAWDTVTNIFNNIRDTIFDKVNGVWGDVNDIFQSLTDTVFEKFDSWEGHIRYAIKNIREFFHDSSKNIQDAITGPFNQAKEWIEQLFDGLNIGNVFEGMIRGLPNGQKILNELPAFANGVQNFMGGRAIVGERGAEEVILPRGSKVVPHSRMEAGDSDRGGQRGINIGTININNDADTDRFFNALDRRQYREELIG